jgi:hypothetical protein
MILTACVEAVEVREDLWNALENWGTATAIPESGGNQLHHLPSGFAAAYRSETVNLRNTCAIRVFHS